MKHFTLLFFSLLSFQFAFSQQRGDIVSFDSLQFYTVDEFANEVQTLTGLPPALLGLEYDFKVYRVLYYTQDYHPDSLTIASALVSIPVNYPCPQLGLMSFGHGLCLKDDQVPSNNQTSNSYSLICKGMAGAGFIGVAPDYIHMSQWSSPGPQAFIHARTEANCTVDLFRAVRQYCAANAIQLSGQVFISGYSQGGNSTVAASKWIQEQYASEFNVMGAAAGGGSYDLSGVCADSLSSTSRVTPERHSLPLVIKSLAVVYEDSLIAWGTGINRYNVIDTVFKSPYKEQLPALLDRTNPMGDNSFLDSIPARMVNDSLLFGFQNNPNFFFRRLLADNDIDDWAPQMPMVLFHSDIDIENPYQNAVNTLQLFQQNGAPDVSLYTVQNQTHPAAGQPFVLFTIGFMKEKRQDCLSSIDDKTKHASVIMNVFPNPANEYLNVELKGTEGDKFTELNIFNLGLQSMYRGTIDKQVKIDLNGFAQGNYLISLEAKDGTKLFKLFSVKK